MAPRPGGAGRGRRLRRHVHDGHQRRPLRVPRVRRRRPLPPARSPGSSSPSGSAPARTAAGSPPRPDESRQSCVTAARIGRDFDLDPRIGTFGPGAGRPMSRTVGGMTSTLDEQDAGRGRRHRRTPRRARTGPPGVPGQPRRLDVRDLRHRHPHGDRQHRRHRPGAPRRRRRRRRRSGARRRRSQADLSEFAISLSAGSIDVGGSIEVTNSGLAGAQPRRRGHRPAHAGHRAGWIGDARPEQPRRRHVHAVLRHRRSRRLGHDDPAGDRRRRRGRGRGGRRPRGPRGDDARARRPPSTSR